jgi:hypothetical protein
MRSTAASSRGLPSRTRTARRERAFARPEARVLARLAELAGRRKPRRRGRDPQSDLGADRGLCRHRHSKQDPHAADHRDLRGLARALPCAVPVARAGEDRADARKAISNEAQLAIITAKDEPVSLLRDLIVHRFGKLIRVHLVKYFECILVLRRDE